MECRGPAAKLEAESVGRYTSYVCVCVCVRASACGGVYRELNGGTSSVLLTDKVRSFILFQRSHSLAQTPASITIAIIG